MEFAPVIFIYPSLTTVFTVSANSPTAFCPALSILPKAILLTVSPFFTYIACEFAPMLINPLFCPREPDPDVIMAPELSFT